MSHKLLKYSKTVLGCVLLLFGITAGAGCGVSDPEEETSGIEFFVAPDGQDDAAGTEDAPLASLQEAWQRVCDMQNSTNEQVVITLRGGAYRQTASCRLETARMFPC